MDIEIVIDLPDDQVAFIDAQVKSGEASSRADVVKKALDRERRRQATLRDVEILKAWEGKDDPDDLDALARYASRVRMDDLD